MNLTLLKLMKRKKTQKGDDAIESIYPQTGHMRTWSLYKGAYSGKGEHEYTKMMELYLDFKTIKEC